MKTHGWAKIPLRRVSCGELNQPLGGVLSFNRAYQPYRTGGDLSALGSWGVSGPSQHRISCQNPVDWLSGALMRSDQGSMGPGSICLLHGILCFFANQTGLGTTVFLLWPCVGSRILLFSDALFPLAHGESQHTYCPRFTYALVVSPCSRSCSYSWHIVNSLVSF